MRGISFCSGIGGLDLAAIAAGIEVVAQVEWDAGCQAVLREHFPNIPLFSDMKELTDEELPNADVWFGGIPCQPYSIAGKKLAEKDTRDLWPTLFRLVQVRRPCWLVIENVGNFARLALDRVWNDLESEGYSVGATVLPACAFGAPHRRERCFTLAYSGSITAQPSRAAPGVASKGCGAEGEVPQRQRGRYASGSSRQASLAHAYVQRRTERYAASGLRDMGRAPRRFAPEWLRGLPQSSMGRAVDGPSGWLDFPARPGELQKCWEAPRVVADRPRDEGRRLKQLGNAVVWPQAYPIFYLLVAASQP